MNLDAITNKYTDSSWKKLYEISCNIIKTVSAVLFFLDLVFLFSDYLNKERGYWLQTPAYEELFYCHLIVAVIAGIYILVYFTRKNLADGNFAPSKIYIESFVFIFLNFAAFISGRIDQLLHGQITVYIFACFLISFFIYQKPVFTFLFHIESYAVLLFFLLRTQTDPDILQANILNSLVVVVLSCFIQLKITIYMQRYYAYRFNLEDIIEERTSELKASLEKVQKLDRLNIVGEMAATVGHEIRNPLTTIRGFLQLFREKQHDAINMEHFELMIHEIDRINEIITEFLSISRTKATIVERGNVAEAVHSILPLIETDSQSKEIFLATDIQEVPDLYFNRQEIIQLVLNLVRNGHEAMTRGGTLTISVYQENVEVIIAIKDEGHGISLEDFKHLGTPFFTTKDMGTGLGLVVCNSIVERHQGRMDIRTGPHGSTFEVHFSIPPELTSNPTP